MKINIEQIEVYQSRIKLKEPFITSLGLLENADNIIVVIRTNTGITGFGECSPFMTINGETVETCFIVAQYLAKALKDKNPLDIKECSSLMDKVIYGNASIKSAFDIALYDIASQ
jgi:L-alanine-DL-glutamate epimerase-like enolase superfamily enzyme